MGRLLGWTLGVGCALAITAAPAAAETRVSIGVFAPNVGAHVEIGRPVYAPPVYRVPVYREPVYRERVYRPVYRERVVVIEPRHDNGRHNGWHKHDRDHDRDWRDERYDRDRRW
jgi:hypothetical protein